ncbi:MAG: DNA mismatch repair endonuclease MutL [Gemmatimonadales bacterium]
MPVTPHAPATRRVQLLPDAVADQIAAGEVVERPASVVKELAENSLDAGARHVRVEIENGGKTSISVGDDGSGMSRDDAVLALDRHATSKLNVLADLVGITTFGFRGEALPAIASVSRFMLQTADDAGEGSEISVTGGRVERVAPCARQRGTTVHVRGLFFNVPARRKFLRSASSETRACHDAMVTLALAHPEAGFEFHADQVCRFQVPAGQSLAERLRALWGREVSDTLLPLAFAAGAFHVSGFVQRPADARPTGRRTQLFVNGRPFRDAFLVRAAEAGYRSAIAPGDRPSMLLLLEVQPGEVDVNVHPAKLEVRFRNRIGLERTVEDAVRHVLGDLVASATLGVGPAPEFPRPASEAAPDAIDLFAPVGDGAEPAPGAAADPLAGVPLMQVFDTYIVYPAEQGVVIVDQHSAHERVLFEAAMRELSGQGAAAQRLLLPETLQLTDEEFDAVDAHGEQLSRVGFEVEPFGGRSVVLHAVPSPRAGFDALACFRELVADLARGRFGGWANRLERFAATYACRAAVKAGDHLSEREMRELLARLFTCELPPHDVHGRSTIVQLPLEELERRFGRR